MFSTGLFSAVLIKSVVATSNITHVLTSEARFLSTDPPSFKETPKNPDKENYVILAKNKGEIVLNDYKTSKKYGSKQVLLWRRSYNIPPPLLDLKDERHPKFDLKYQKFRPHELPRGECLKDTVNRVLHIWNKDIVPKILAINI